MDTDTGEIFAMASVRRNDDTGVVEITSGNFAAVDAYEPGSVAKVITVAGGAQRGRRHARHGLQRPVAQESRGATTCWPTPSRTPTSRLTVAQILVESSNIGTIHDPPDDQASRSSGEYMRAFGLGEATALEFPGESPGILKHWKDVWGTEQCHGGVRPGRRRARPIQLVAAINVIANDGTYVAPEAGPLDRRTRRRR